MCDELVILLTSRESPCASAMEHGDVGMSNLDDTGSLVDGDNDYIGGSDKSGSGPLPGGMIGARIRAEWWRAALIRAGQTLVGLAFVQCVLSAYLGSRYYFGLIVSYIVGALGVTGVLVGMVSTTAVKLPSVVRWDPAAVRLDTIAALALNPDVWYLVVAGFAAATTALFSLQSVGTKYLGTHKSEAVDYEIQVRHTTYLLGFASILNIAALASVIVCTVAARAIHAGLYGGGKPHARCATALTQTYLRSVIVLGVFGALVTGRSTYGLYHLEEASLSSDEMLMSRAIGIMLFVEAICALLPLHARFIGFAVAACIPPIAAATIF